MRTVWLFSPAARQGTPASLFGDGRDDSNFANRLSHAPPIFAAGQLVPPQMCGLGYAAPPIVANAARTRNRSTLRVVTLQPAYSAELQ